MKENEKLVKKGLLVKHPPKAQRQPCWEGGKVKNIGGGGEDVLYLKSWGGIKNVVTREPIIALKNFRTNRGVQGAKGRCVRFRGRAAERA